MKSMVNPTQWAQLGKEGQKEFRALFTRFQSALRENGVHDRCDLGMDWRVIESDGEYVISNGDATLQGVTFVRKDVIQALFDDGCANLNR
jgi:hypothetical protein